MTQNLFKSSTTTTTTTTQSSASSSNSTSSNNNNIIKNDSQINNTVLIKNLSLIKQDQFNTPMLSNSQNQQTQSDASSMFYFGRSSKLDDSDFDEIEDADKVIEESPNGRWSKLITEIFVQRLADFDSSHLAIDTDRGCEAAWNEMKFIKNTTNSNLNRFDSIETVANISEKLSSILNFLIKLDHSNILKYYDYWFVDNQLEAKLVVITEYTAAGSLRRVLDSARMSKTKVKPHTYKRWLNQILYSIKYLHTNQISIFQGNISSETIFIQNSGVIKLTPTLLSINGICEIAGSVIKSHMTKTSNKSIDLIKLNEQTMINDLHAIGRIAIQIFTAHVKIQSPSSPRPRSYRFIKQNSSSNNHMSSFDEDMLQLADCYASLDDDMQCDFLQKIFQIGKDKNINIDTIWFHPFINIIESLKVLSVFSLLNYFQNNSKFNNINSNNCDKIINRKNSAQNNSNDCKNLNCNLNPKIVLNNQNQNNQSPSGSSNNLKYAENMCNNKKRTSSSNSLNDLNLSQNVFIKQFYKSNSNSKISKSNSYNQLKVNSCNNSERRKISLSFLTNCQQLKIPHQFFGILEDIRSGLHPRLFKEPDSISNSSNNSSNLKEISSHSCLDFVIQHKQIIDRRSSVSAFNKEGLIDSNSNCIRGSIYPEVTQSNLEIVDCNDNKKYPTEARRIASEECFIKKIEKDESIIQLNLQLKFNDNLTCRALKCYFPNDILNYFKEHYCQFGSDRVIINDNFNDISGDDYKVNNLILMIDPLENKIENICKHLTNELIDYGLINFRDHSLIVELLLRTIRGYVLSILKKS